MYFKTTEGYGKALDDLALVQRVRSSQQWLTNNVPEAIILAEL
jgi:hypothetical protein